MRILEKILSHSRLPLPADLDRESTKVAIIRILTAALVAIRFGQIMSFDPAIVMENQDIVALFCLALVAFACGFSSTFSSISLIIMVRKMDKVFHTDTLGTTILISLIAVLFLADCGRAYSLDNLLRRRFGAPGILRYVWGDTRRSSRLEIHLAYHLGIFIYALISFCALFLHLQDPDWVGGLTVKSLLTNSYLCRGYPWFRWFEAHFPMMLLAISAVTGIMQSIFQFLMLPMIFTKWGMNFVKYYGLFFSLASLFLINLSFLPHVELLLWLLIFFPAPPGRSASTETEPPTRAFPATLKLFYVAYFLTSLLFFYNFFAGTFGDYHSKFRRTLYKAGFDIPNVFNRTDLSLGDQWMVTYVKDGSGWTRSSLCAEDGSRLNYQGFDILWFSNHNNDALYFGTTLLYRRLAIGEKDYEAFHARPDIQLTLQRRLGYDYRYFDRVGTVIYKVVVFESRSSEVAYRGDGDRHQSRQVYEATYSFDGKELNRLAE